jgi:hypothetical protein
MAKIIGYLLLVMVVLLAFGYIHSCHTYEKEMFAKEQAISELEGRVEASEVRESAALKEKEQAEHRAEKYLADYQKKEIELAKAQEQHKQDIEHIQAMSPNEVVNMTVEFLQCTEVTLTQMGMLLSEVCAKVNLVHLADCEYFKDRVGDITIQRDACMSSVEELKKAKAASESAYMECGQQLSAEKEMVKKVKEELNLEKKYGHSKTTKAFLMGGATGAVLVAILSLVK